MSNSIYSLLIAGLGAAIATVFQHFFQRYAESQRVRREIVESRLLQLQNSVESLYYRANNLLGWAGKATMSEDYYRKTSVFALARVLGHELLFASSGVYAKLGKDTELKFHIKAALHNLNSAMDDHGFQYYYRLLLAEMVTESDRVISLNEFLDRWSDPRFSLAVTAASNFVEKIDALRLGRIRNLSVEIVDCHKKTTGVPSALDLTGASTSRAPA